MPELPDAVVLVVDDDPKLVEILEKHLGRLGYRVVTALGGAEALALLDAGTRVDVALSDVQMKGLDGRSLMVEIHRRSPEIRVILMTAFGAVSEAVEAMREGAFWYLTKPFKIEEAALVLRRAVAETAMGRRIDQLERYLGRSEVAQAVRSQPGERATLDEVERAHVHRVLIATGWNRSQAAEILGIDRRTLFTRIQRYGLVEPTS